MGLGGTNGIITYVRKKGSMRTSSSSRDGTAANPNA